MEPLPFTTKHFNEPQRQPAAPVFGPLEREVMELLWQRGEASVRDLHLAVGARLAYTTLMTTLDRLHKKGWLTRRKAGRAFFYAPRQTPAELERGLTQRALDRLLGRGAEGVEPLLACIVDAVSEHDRELLDELDRLVQAKRRALDAGATNEGGRQ